MLSIMPRIIIGALRGGAGKTVLSLGLTAAWRDKGRTVAPFKKGPDFIDSGWLAFAAGRPCYNLDPFMMTNEQMIRSFLSRSAGTDIALIEGNRGLFDGFDIDGCCSTAELGKLLKTPVILIADVTMATRTVAALVVGCQQFDPGLRVAGVILNRVAGDRQESIVRASIERYCGIPVMGAVPKLRGNPFPERHMGLMPHQESDHAEKAVSWARGVVEQNLDLEAIWDLAQDVEPLDAMEDEPYGDDTVRPTTTPSPHIGFVRDSSFWFYYPENLEQLKNQGATLVEVNSITQEELPDLDALYIGGGFPETQAEVLAKNRSFRDSLRQRIEGGLPVYAECGGLMYLGKSLHVDGKTYPMVGALPVELVLEQRPQGHGYTILEVSRSNPYFQVGEVLKGHEFHYSRPLTIASEGVTSVFRVCRGYGLDGQRDGLLKGNLLATYTHLHGAGNPWWAKTFYRLAARWRDLKEKNFHTEGKRGIDNSGNLGYRLHL